jgi:endonuclease YncB( thermonuclease family)
MAKTATRGRRRKSSAKSRRGAQGGPLAWLFVGAVAVGGIALYDNWKSVRPMLASRVPDASVITAAIKPDAPKTTLGNNAPRQQPASQSQRHLPPAAIPVPAAQPVKLASAAGSPAIPGNASATFGYCGQGQHVNCVGDGGIFWYKGEKILIADAVVPDVGAARCADERRAGFAAKSRLLKLLNAGPFVMNVAGKASAAGAPRVVSRNGLSFGSALIAEGLARKPGATVGGWCA